MTKEEIADKMKADFNKDIVDLFVGETIVYDDKGNRVPFCDVPPASRVEYVKYKDFSFEDLKKAFEDVCGVEERDGSYYPIK